MSKYENPLQPELWSNGLDGEPLDCEQFALCSLADVSVRHRLITDLQELDLVDEAVDPIGDLTEYGLQSMRHILIGDDEKGGHHLRSIIELEVDDRVFASQIRPEESGSKRPLTYYRKRQKIGENGTYNCKVVEINGVKKAGGSSMFPDDWSEQDVLNSVVEVAKTEPVFQDELVNIHRATENGVNIQVVTSRLFGRIISAYPDQRS